MHHLYLAGAGWSPAKKNPFSNDGGYGDGWSAAILENGRGSGSNLPHRGARVYAVRIPLLTAGAWERVADFIRYESAHGRRIILQADRSRLPTLRAFLAQLQDQAPEPEIRADDPEWLVHSTTLENWESIQRCGALLAPCVLREQGIADPLEIGLKPLLEPADYSDYIMLDRLDGCGELVVQSRQRGVVCIDADAPYTPGARLYVNARRILADGRGVRDGVHILKVKSRLPLGYVAMAVTKDRLGPERVWTPTAFTAAANAYFRAAVSEKRNRAGVEIREEALQFPS